MLPTAFPSSAYHLCLTPGTAAHFIRGSIAMPYIAIASGSPRVVPSREVSSFR